jgi:hypothetical protein
MQQKKLLVSISADNATKKIISNKNGGCAFSIDITITPLFAKIEEI